MNQHELAVSLEATVAMIVETSSLGNAARKAIFHSEDLCLGPLSVLWDAVILAAKALSDALSGTDESEIEVQTGILHGVMHLLRLRHGGSILDAAQEAWLSLESLILRLQDRRLEATAGRRR